MAAITAQMATVPIANPPLKPPNHLYIMSYKAVARPENCRIVAIKIYKGTATKTCEVKVEKVEDRIAYSAPGPTKKR
jgi:hypothetical protein